MKTRFAAVALAALGMIVVLAVTAANAADSPALKEFTSKDGGFSVMLPETPKETKQGANSMFTVDQGNKVYMLMYQDIAGLGHADAATLKKSLEAGRDNGVKALQGKLLSSQAIKLGDSPGLEFQIEMPDQSIYRSRIYQVKERLYQMIVLGPKDFANSKTVDSALDSFKLTK